MGRTSRSLRVPSFCSPVGLGNWTRPNQWAEPDHKPVPFFDSFLMSSKPDRTIPPGPNLWVWTFPKSVSSCMTRKTQGRHLSACLCNQSYPICQEWRQPSDYSQCQARGYLEGKSKEHYIKVQPVILTPLISLSILLLYLLLHSLHSLDYQSAFPVEPPAG